MRICITFFIFTLSFENLPIEDAEYQTNPWTHHPIYSIMTVGNNIFTRKSRSALLWINIINICMFSAIFYNHIGYGGESANIFLFGVYACVVSWGATYIHGYFLRKYYLNKYFFVKTGDEHYDDDAQRNLFIFYFFTFLWMWGGYTIFIWQMQFLHAELDGQLSNYWAASFFIALALDWILFDMMAVCLCYSRAFQRFFKWKGYLYDEEICHWTYKNQKKQL